MAKSWTPLEVETSRVSAGKRDSYRHAENVAAFLDSLGITSSSEVVVLFHGLDNMQGGVKVDSYFRTTAVVFCEEDNATKI